MSSCTRFSKQDKSAPINYRHIGNQTGFTIVELLVVIVVVGIIASISINAYSGIQDRAHNTRTVAAMRQYVSKISGYYVLNSSYPTMPNGAGGVCLGVGYTDRVGNDGVGDCGETAYPVNEDDAYTTAIFEIAAGVVNDKAVNMPYQTSSWVGGAMHYFPPDSSLANEQDHSGFTVDGVSRPYYAMFVLNGGNQHCKVSNLVKPDESQYGWPKMTAQLDGQEWSWSDGETTACVISLPS